jgi:3-deoxy-D-manno-octulosonate 8-phosphate phosphatase KdsC-like HAD superfamily phosphatase
MAKSKIPSPAAWSRVKLFAMDVDGILTDGTVLISSNGTEAKRFSILDGLGRARAVLAGNTVDELTKTLVALSMHKVDDSEKHVEFCLVPASAWRAATR